MSKIIIGIHGLGNKPPPKTLSEWWQASMREGLQRIKKPQIFINFELVYWAHYFHPLPLDPEIKDKDHALYLDDPYVPAKGNALEKKPGELRQKIISHIEQQLEKIFLNEDYTINYASITDFIIHNFFSELETYYNNYCVTQSKQDCRAKEVICSVLADVLKKHRQKKILLIAHSMGSIIAYDVLTQYVPEVPVDTFVTIGSPLGLPFMKSRIAADLKKDPSQEKGLNTPENILSNWYNLSDLRDKIAINYKLTDDFKENAGHVRPEDIIVTNNYEVMGEKNPHKAYGYLRTPQLAGIIADFLGTSQ